MDRRTRLVFAAMGSGMLAVVLGGLLYLGATPVEKLTLAVIFCGGMSMLFTP
ncbi:MAG TPA: hypothetical protein VGT02_00375 [Methylomirabilota bacterium]|jgi:hypothetical protein|nr:hypothetical protein [Methylomirabilota bacterium]